MIVTDDRHFFSALETVDSRIDEDSGTIQQVSLIRLGEAKGHKDDDGRQVFVDKTTLQQVYDYCVTTGAIKLKADHGGGVFTTIGYVDNYSLQTDKVSGDAHIYDTEEEKPKIFEIARKNPAHMGISLEFDGKDDVAGKQCLARCDEVYTIALVSDPAANKSLFGKKDIAKIKKTDTNTNMSKKTLSEAEDKKPTADAAGEDDSKGEAQFKKYDDMLTKCEQLYSKMEEWGSRLSKLENPDSTSDKDNSKEDPKATDPSEQPATQNKDGDTAFDDAKESDEDKKMAKVAKMASEATAKTFAAKFGVNLQPAGHLTKLQQQAETTFEALLEEEKKRFDGDEGKAMVHLLGKVKTDEKIRKAYSKYRPAGKK